GAPAKEDQRLVARPPRPEVARRREGRRERVVDEDPLLASIGELRTLLHFARGERGVCVAHERAPRESLECRHRERPLRASCLYLERSGHGGRGRELAGELAARTRRVQEER